MDEQPGSPQARQTSGTYTHGHTRPVTQVMAARTAEREGAFFLPFLQAGMRVLDVGCGPGTITLGLARAVAPGEVVGLDNEPTAVEAARALAMDRQVRNVRFMVGTA
jgi:ubiquinone/menaquinone biosynthesis C-methylase UbiE